MGVVGVAALARRKTVGRLHPWPDFIIIGAQKAGTSSLYQHLSEQPAVAPARRKEVRYYDISYGNGPAWYRSHFPRHAPGQITGEASPYYVIHPLAPERVAADLPNVRLIALLRNPVERAYAGWANFTRLGYEHLSFEDALAREEEILPGAAAQILLDDPPSVGREHPHRIYSYRARGRYLDQLLEWTHYFPRERILTLISERLFTDPGELARVHRFLNLPAPASGLPARNVSRYDAMRPETRAELTEYFREPNRELAEWLGENPGWD